MAILIGTDEAGYGPNLGPLLIAATAWRVPDEAIDGDLYERLAAAVCDAKEDPEGRLPVADSKLVYRPHGGLAGLERGVLAMLQASGHRVQTWRDAWEHLAPGSGPPLDGTPWYRDFDAPSPRDVERTEIDQHAARIEHVLAASDTELLGMRATAVFPAQFNALVDQGLNKGAALTRSTLQLVAELLPTGYDEPVWISCDKHGGRNKYTAELQPVFPEFLIECLGEGRQQSRYRWGPPNGHKRQIQFITKGESFLPSALASMIAKYLRELAMQAFNDFWAAQVPGLRRTAGYPMDARRFKRDIASVQKRLKIDDQTLWRCR